MNQTDQSINRIKGMLELLNRKRYGTEIVPDQIYRKQVGYNERGILEEAVTEDGWKLFQNGQAWGGIQVHDCFQIIFQVPGKAAGQELWLHVFTGVTDIWNMDNPQFLVMYEGEMLCGMDMNHQEVCITKKAEEGQELKIGIYGYSNSMEAGNYLKIVLTQKHKEIEKLYFDCKVPFEAALELREDDYRRGEMIDLLNQVMNRLELRRNNEEEFYSSVVKTNDWLREVFYEKLDKKSEATVHSIGHTHIDVAWKWPIRQTREKVLRSFSTVLHLMEVYPEYRFMSSQPQLYQFVKEESPVLYERIKERIREGRWETEGAMWLEADCNLTSGESLVRQILYGKKFFQEEFEQGDNRVLWLPDVFGYSAAMPQILKKANISYFMTTKIGWNEYNLFPHDVMMWKGIDGTEVLTYFITTKNHESYPELNRKPNYSTTYNGRQNVSQIMGTWQRFRNKNLTDEVLTCYGYGDGGGGPTAQMLEENRRMQCNIPGCPVTKQTFVREFFEGLEENLKGKKIPKWNGELYLEFHRGTYTSMARNKKYNRKSEFKNADAEFFAVLAQIVNPDYKYPKEKLDKVWKLTMLNQFHDILPGSSIEEVYLDSQKQYETIFSLDEEIIRDAQNRILPGQAGQPYQDLVIFNSLGFERDLLLELPKNICCNLEQAGISIECQCLNSGNNLYFFKKVPAKGYYIVKQKEMNSKRNSLAKTANIFEERRENGGFYLETRFYKVSFDENGEITSLYDKENCREVGRKGERLNRLMAFEDRPFEYDAWNIDACYEEKEWDVNELEEWRVIENGPLMASIFIRRSFLNSSIEQTICFYQHSRRIDFKTIIDWKEEQILLKAAFPIAVQTAKAVCDIQFGNVERPTHKNTSWDEARFEFCAHKWVDVNECGYGAALLNDCKYGYDVQESVMRLTLLKSGIFPYPDADKERHEFTYSLLPHKGDFREGQVIKEAYDLNVPAYWSETIICPSFGDIYSAIYLDKENVILDTLKRSEDGEAYIIRMYECFGMRSRVKCNLTGLHGKQAAECNLLEQKIQNCTLKDEIVEFTILPYEIKTFWIKTS